MKTRLYIPVFALTLLLSAGLLFSVQPMFSKMVLPLLGGTPQVWNTAMLFFQMTLLAGYAYAHGTTRFLGIRAQAVLHVALLVVFTLVLPLAIPAGWMPPKDSDPTLWQLSVMALSIGGPFFVLAASAPMLQRWFASSDHKDANNPYFLYGASNLGSMGALLLYPVIAEPLLTLAGQSQVWSVGYFGLILMIVVAASMVWRGAAGGVLNAARAASDEADGERVTWRMRASWVVLAFIPSSLMLGVTTFITTDVASAPLLWIVPLALYVGTFILVFAKRVILSNRALSAAQGVLVAGLVITLMSNLITNPWAVIGVHLMLFFVTAWMCHGILAAKRPHQRHLTEFYLLMSFGGALGGVLNAIIAPQMFTSALEYPLILAAACLCRMWGVAKVETPNQKRDIEFDLGLAAIAVGAAAFSYWMPHSVYTVGMVCAFVVSVALVIFWDRRWLFAGIAAVAILTHPPANNVLKDNIIHSERNFFGILTVFNAGDMSSRSLLHGTTTHGTQSLWEAYRLEPLSYYSAHSPLANLFDYFDTREGAQKIGVLGLGAGATACYRKEGRQFDFFEIDPAVVAIAENPDYFTYLSDCGSPYEVVLGDARMTIQDKPDGHYDLLVLDVFSSDNIPVHVLTEEAIEAYMSKLKPHGAVIFHVSNNYLDLEPVIARTAEKMGVSAYGRFASGGTLEGTDIGYYASHYVMMTRSDSVIDEVKSARWTPAITQEGIASWSDQYSNIISVIGGKTAQMRAEIEKEFDEADARGECLVTHDSDEDAAISLP